MFRKKTCPHGNTCQTRGSPPPICLNAAKGLDYVQVPNIQEMLNLTKLSKRLLTIRNGPIEKIY